MFSFNCGRRAEEPPGVGKTYSRTLVKGFWPALSSSRLVGVVGIARLPVAGQRRGKTTRFGGLGTKIHVEVDDERLAVDGKR